MEHDTIIKAADILKKELAEKRDVVTLAKGEVAAVYARLNAIQDLCKHPDGYATSRMGDSGYYCPDCKYSR